MRAFHRCRQKVAALQELLGLSNAEVSRQFGALAPLFCSDMSKVAARFAFLRALTGESRHQQTRVASVCACRLCFTAWQVLHWHMLQD
jgi:hypothetical protein